MLIIYTFLFVMYATLFVLHFYFDLKNIYSSVKDISIIKELKFEVSDIVIGVLPTIITIVSIIFSINDDEIYGVSINSFRKMRSNDYFSFGNMIYFMIITYIFYGVSRMLDIRICIYFVDIVIIVFSIFFIAQNIKLIEKNDEYIFKTLNNIFKNNAENGILIENTNRKNIDTILQELLDFNGLKEVFSYLKTNDLILNSNILTTLFNEYYSSISSLLKFVRVDDIKKTKYIPKEIQDKINSIYDNVYEIFKEKYEIEYNIKKYSDENIFYHSIVNIIILLNDFYKSLTGFGINNLAYEKTKDLLDLIISNQNINDDIKISFINSLLFDAFINRKIQFINEFIDVLENTYDCELKSFLIIYSSFFIFFEGKSAINDNFKIKLENKISEGNIDINSPLEWISFKEIIKRQIKTISFEYICLLIKRILKFYNEDYKNTKYLRFYSPAFENWIELLLLKYEDNKFNKNFFDQIFNEFNFIEKIFFSVILNDCWFDDNNEFKNYIENHESNVLIYLDFYEIEIAKYSFDKDSKIVDYFRNIKNKFLLDIYEKSCINDDLIAAANIDFYKMIKKENFKNVDNNIACTIEEFIKLDDMFIDSFFEKSGRFILLKNELYKELITFLNDVSENNPYNFEIIDKDNVFRKLNKNEIDQVIKDNFKANNDGLYNFNKFSNNKKFYFNKEELSKLIEWYYFHIELKILYKVDCSNS